MMALQVVPEEDRQDDQRDGPQDEADDRDDHLVTRRRWLRLLRGSHAGSL
jgi:hypothetical protein